MSQKAIQYFSCSSNNNNFVNYYLTKHNCKSCKQLCFSCSNKKKLVCLSCYVKAKHKLFNVVATDKQIHLLHIAFTIFDLLILSLSEHNYNIYIYKSKSSDSKKTVDTSNFHTSIDLNSSIFSKIDKQLKFLLSCKDFTLDREKRNSPRYSRYSFLLFYYLYQNKFFDDKTICFPQYSELSEPFSKLEVLEENVVDNIVNVIDFNKMSKLKANELTLFGYYSAFIRQHILIDKSLTGDIHYKFSAEHSRTLKKELKNGEKKTAASSVPLCITSVKNVNDNNIKADNISKNDSQQVIEKQVDEVNVNSLKKSSSTSIKLSNNDNFDITNSLLFNKTNIVFSNNASNSVAINFISSLEKRFAKILNEIHNEIIDQFNIFLDIKSNISFVKQFEYFCSCDSECHSDSFDGNTNESEIDFLINNQIGFELNGLFFHSLTYLNYKETKRNKFKKLDKSSVKGISDYHFEKFSSCFRRGIKLFSLQQYDFYDENKLKQYIKNILFTHLNEINSKNANKSIDCKQSTLYNVNFTIKNQTVELSAVKTFIDRCCENYFVLQNHNKHRIYKTGHYFIRENNKIIGVLIKTNVFSGSNYLQNCYQIVLADDFYYVYNENFIYCLKNFIKDNNIQLVVNNNYQANILSVICKYNDAQKTKKLNYDFREL